MFINKPWFAGQAKPETKHTEMNVPTMTGQLLCRPTNSGGGVPHVPLALGYFLSSCCKASSGNGHSSSKRMSAVPWLAADVSLCFSRA